MKWKALVYFTLHVRFGGPPTYDDCGPLKRIVKIDQSFSFHPLLFALVIAAPGSLCFFV
jgi:hypothetical protein